MLVGATWEMRKLTNVGNFEVQLHNFRTAQDFLSSSEYLAVQPFTNNAPFLVISRGGAEQTFHDTASNTDILLYKGDYVSYMTPTTKNTRRSDVG